MPRDYRDDREKASFHSANQRILTHFVTFDVTVA